MARTSDLWEHQSIQHRPCGTSQAFSLKNYLLSPPHDGLASVFCPNVERDSGRYILVVCLIPWEWGPGFGTVHFLPYSTCTYTEGDIFRCCWLLSSSDNYVDCLPASAWLFSSRHCTVICRKTLTSCLCIDWMRSAPFFRVWFVGRGIRRFALDFVQSTEQEGMGLCEVVSDYNSLFVSITGLDKILT